MKLVSIAVDNFIVRNLSNGFGVVDADLITVLSVGYLLLMVTTAVVGPAITPYEYDKSLYGDDGQLLRSESPSIAHPLGTTDLGYDVLSRLIYGTRPTVITGLLGGSVIITLGLSIGVTAGYVGGRVDDVLMRFTDFIYGVPLLPFAIVLLALLGVDFITSILVIGLILWRGSARVLRSQVLQIKNRPFIIAARSTGASHWTIVVKHILPNIASMAFLFFALGIGYTIIIQASLSFLGLSDPFVPSWGIMLRNAYTSGQMSVALWWSLPPGLLISLTVLSTFILGRRFESSDQSDQAMAVGQ